MPFDLRVRLALVALFGVFLIPVMLSSLRGLTHVVSCRQEVAHPFEVEFGSGEEPLLVSSAVISETTDPVCSSLAADLEVRSTGQNRLELTIPIANRGTGDWRGTVSLRVGGTLIPIQIGLVPAGTTKSETIVLRLPDGTTGFEGSLLIGP
ncbi:MAG TPA: hypothetical protein VIA81_00295 [Acidimicrobiia bacterium]|jgi:hypothetical protein